MKALQGPRTAAPSLSFEDEHKPMKPDFICIGAQKAGTSWLYARLQSHPEFSMPAIKELHYFDRSPDYPSPGDLAETRLSKRLKDPRYALRASATVIQSLITGNVRRARWWSRYYFKDYSDAWYRSLFELETGITGDITPSYSILEAPDVARLHAFAPEAKLIFLMRNPIERAWSMYRFREKFGGAIDLDNLDEFKNFVESHSQTARSDYLRTIDLYLDSYNSDQMILGFYDALSDQPQALLSALLKHLGAKDTQYRRGLEQFENKSRQIEMPQVYREYLESRYRNEIKQLADRYGGYAAKWLDPVSSQGAEQSDQVDLPPPVIST